MEAASPRPGFPRSTEALKKRGNLEMEATTADDVAGSERDEDDGHGGGGQDAAEGPAPCHGGGDPPSASRAICATRVITCLMALADMASTVIPCASKT